MAQNQLLEPWIQNLLANVPHNLLAQLTDHRGIIEVAGGPGDRWLGHRKMAGREESPDTVLSHAGQYADAERRLRNGQRNS